MVRKHARSTSLIIAAFMVPFVQVMLMPRTLAVSPIVVISEVSTEAENASQEFIELYNNSPDDVSIEGWVVQMRSSNNALNRSVTLSETLKGHSHALLASTNHPTACVVADFACFSSTMATSGGHVVLLNSAGDVVDKLGWGSAVDPEGMASATPTIANPSMIRKTSSQTATLQDTDNNSVDFQIGVPSPTAGGVYTPEPEPEPDPEPTPSPNCQGVFISEILPNPAGEDSGQEFIELYNETSSSVDLTGCILKVGTAEQVLSGTIEPLSYRAFYGLTLSNAAGGQVIFMSNTATTSVNYPGNLGDNEAYALVGGVWRDEMVPSPNSATVIIVSTDEQSDSEDELEACPAGKYRNTETNRCRNAATATTSLAPCEPGQVRNPDTNRCRKDTASESSLTACKIGQERNPETNRCRNVAAAKSTNPMAQPAKAASKPVSYYVLGIVAVLGLAYALYEYRSSIRNFFTRKGQKT